MFRNTTNIKRIVIFLIVSVLILTCTNNVVLANTKTCYQNIFISVEDFSVEDNLVKLNEIESALTTFNKLTGYETSLVLLILFQMSKN